MLIFGPRRKSVFSCLMTLIFGVLLVVIGALLIYSFKGPYWKAMRSRTTDPCNAARLFAVDIELDKKESLNSVYELSKLNSTCAMREIVELMALPDGRYIKQNARQALWQSGVTSLPLCSFASGAIH
jgi:hypothetical protein